MRFFNSNPKQRLNVSPVAGVLNISVGSDVEVYVSSQIDVDTTINISDPNADSGDYFFLHLYAPVSKTITISGPQGSNPDPIAFVGALVLHLIYNQAAGKYIISNTI